MKAWQLMCGIVPNGLQDCKFTKLKIFKQDLITVAFGGIHMNFITTNEFDNFIFSEVHISDVRYSGDVFTIVLDDVKILPENSKNRDIRTIRTNGLVLKLNNAKILSLIEEGYKIYDADGNLMKNEDDIAIEEADYTEVMNNFLDGYAFVIEKSSDSEFVFVIDGANERTYNLVVCADSDSEEWDRFMNPEE